jgi:hypothetical protein
MTRHLCIVARDNAPLYGFLTIAFRERPPGADTLDVVLDRRRVDALPASDRAAAYTDRRRHARVVEALRTRGYAIVAGPGGMPSPSDEAFIERAVGILADVERRGPLALRFDQQRRAMVRTLVRIAVGVVIVLAIVWMLATLPKIGGLARVSDDVGHWGDAVLGRLERAWTTLGGRAGSSPSREPDGRRSRLTEPAMPPVTLPTVPPPTLPPPALTAPAAPAVTQRAAPVLPPASARPAPRAESRPTPPLSRAADTVPAPLVEASLREPAPGESSEAVDTSSLAAFNGLPRVELSRQRAGDGIVYIVRLADTGGRPVPGAQVWMRGQSGDGPAREARLDPVDPPGTYRSSPLPPNTLPPQLSVRVFFSNMRVLVPVEP